MFDYLRHLIRDIDTLVVEIFIAVNATIFRDNLSEVPFFTKLARDFDYDVRLSLLHPNGRGEGMSKQALDPEEILRLREYCHIMRKKELRYS
jgi:MoaA/NifB/PqqE/SkfB family radical SAM enzyme